MEIVFAAPTEIQSQRWVAGKSETLLLQQTPVISPHLHLFPQRAGKA